MPQKATTQIQILVGMKTRIKRAQNDSYIAFDAFDCNVIRDCRIIVLLSKWANVSILQPNDFCKPAIFATISNMISAYLDRNGACEHVHWGYPKKLPPIALMTYDVLIRSNEYRS